MPAYKKHLQTLTLSQLRAYWKNVTGEESTIGAAVTCVSAEKRARRKLITRLTDTEAFRSPAPALDPPEGYAGPSKPCSVCGVKSFHRCCTARVSNDCGKKATGFDAIEKVFGFRQIAKAKIPQPQCRECRRVGQRKVKSSVRRQVEEDFARGAITRDERTHLLNASQEEVDAHRRGRA